MRLKGLAGFNSNFELAISFCLVNLEDLQTKVTFPITALAGVHSRVDLLIANSVNIQSDFTH